MNILLLLSVLLPMGAAPAAFFLGKRGLRAAYVVTVAACAVSACLAAAGLWHSTAADFSVLGLHFAARGLGGGYGALAALLWTLCALFLPRYFRGKEKVPRFCAFFLLTLGATIGVFFAADLMTLFLFFELMSLSSCVWVAQEETHAAMDAAKTYLTVSVVGGLTLLMGLFLLYAETGTLVIAELAAPKDPRTLLPACLCLLFGFGTKAGVFPVHIWLPRAHPEAPAPASALLSGVLTKAGAYGALLVTARIMYVSAGWNTLLLCLGLVTMVVGAVPALFATHLKKILALSSLSQIGFIFTGIAMVGFTGGEELAPGGVILYMVNHSLSKIVLFLFSGAVYCLAHTLDLNELRGFGKGKPLLHLCFLSGALSLAGAPLFCGYLGKTLIHEAIAEYAATGGVLFHTAEWVFLFSGGLTAAYLAKIYFLLFWSGEKRKTDHRLGAAAVTGLVPCAVLLPVIGTVPALWRGIVALGVTGAPLEALPAHFAPFTLHNLSGIAISLGIGAAVYLGLIRGVLLRNGAYRVITVPVSLEKTVYVPVFRALRTGLTAFCRALCTLPAAVITFFRTVVFGALCRAVCDLPALCILLTKQLALRPQGRPHARRHRFLVLVGDAYDRLRGRETRTAANRLIDAYATLQDTTGRVLSNFSFALLMTCLGICIILVFLLVQ